MFGFNTQWGPFKHQKVRLAFSYALNRPQILASAGFNEGMVTGILTPALSRWAIPTSQYPSYTQNIATAKRLLAEAGYPHGFSFNIMAPSSFPVDLSSAVIIANQLQAIGVTAHVVPTEWGTYVNNWVKRSFESFTGENGDWTDPDLAMYAALHTGGRPMPSSSATVKLTNCCSRVAKVKHFNNATRPTRNCKKSSSSNRPCSTLSHPITYLASVLR